MAIEEVRVHANVRCSLCRVLRQTLRAARPAPLPMRDCAFYERYENGATLSSFVA
ncbi:MAG: hypothetical protein J6I62_01475 [Selenomonadaceae bacterium]|nr:hypothetical protein [Selenomonadaceae bacterium]